MGSRNWLKINKAAGRNNVGKKYLGKIKVWKHKNISKEWPKTSGI